MENHCQLFLDKVYAGNVFPQDFFRYIHRLYFLILSDMSEGGCEIKHFKKNSFIKYIIYIYISMCFTCNEQLDALVLT